MGTSPMANNSATAWKPCSNEPKATVEKDLASGARTIFRVAFVIIPNTPSVPMNRWLRSGPEAPLTALVVSTSPLGSTTSKPFTWAPMGP